MRNTIILTLLTMVVVSCTSKKDHTYLEGTELFSTVEKYVSLGEHRTATTADNATSEWLGKELSDIGYEVKFTEFSFKQFFLKEASVTGEENSRKYKAFPLWYVNDNISLTVEGILVNDTDNVVDVRDKIVLLNFSFGEQGQSAGQIRKRLEDLIEAGARSIIGYKENDAGEIVAFNAPKAGKPWKAPIVIVSPGDAKLLDASIGKAVKVDISGDFEEVTAKNVYGTIGDGDQYIVVSTPISGWFTCGGERGPGVAVWLALARWAATEKLPYKFVFTGNSGHELGFWGADEFLEHDAPPTDKTKLWIHLGAGLATLSWKSTPSGLIKEDKVDAGRNFFYTTSVKTQFDKAFQHVEGHRWDTQEKNGGELIHVVNKGYPNALGVSYAHPFFHAPGDDVEKTSPQVLQEAALAFKNFIVNVVNN